MVELVALVAKAMVALVAAVVPSTIKEELVVVTRVAQAAMRMETPVVVVRTSLVPIPVPVAEQTPDMAM